MLGGHFDQPIHAELRKHRRFQPCLLVSRNKIVGRDLSGRSPTGKLIKRYRSESGTILMFAQKPGLAGDVLHDYSPEDDGDGIGDGGIKRVWPACNFKGLSM